ncbi:hypothetical protein FPV21_01900 [Carnobacterium sp. PL12RED10]|uniref:hypothetical protein n=1 Tax=Carnobacterium sp. PL12RED10 TaxID=2592351 RepID=UPI0013FC7CB1|nr:hypothetical protein [Carnobacterium sp. PL12RED10]KAF3302259.1 hypothetical protein FPV21_01900 [Carnobacterium sp. PL12RED10]
MNCKQLVLSSLLSVSLIGAYATNVEAAETSTVADATKVEAPATTTVDATEASVVDATAADAVAPAEEASGAMHIGFITIIFSCILKFFKHIFTNGY